MIISKTPYRVSFFGGGTDLPQWYGENGGSVISTSIDKYCYITCRHLPPLFDYKHRLVYSQSEIVNDINKIRHRGIRGVFQYLKISSGLEVHHDGDLPAKTGLGSSSAFTVGLLNALYLMQGVRKDSKTLAQEAIHIERDLLGECVGSQDQVATSHGGFNRIDFSLDGSFTVQKIALDTAVKAKLKSHLLLVFTGIRRHATAIEETKISNMEKNHEKLSFISNLVETAQREFQSKNFHPSIIGELLHETWEQKKLLSSAVSTPYVDELYQVARKNGAYGGKLLGAGGGGFLLLLAPPEKQGDIKSALSKMTFIDFDFENEGATVFNLKKIREFDK